jgi:hypothetical protein
MRYNKRAESKPVKLLSLLLLEGPDNLTYGGIYYWYRDMENVCSFYIYKDIKTGKHELFGYSAKRDNFISSIPGFVVEMMRHYDEYRRRRTTDNFVLMDIADVSEFCDNLNSFNRVSGGSRGVGHSDFVSIVRSLGLVDFDNSRRFVSGRLFDIRDDVQILTYWNNDPLGGEMRNFKDLLEFMIVDCGYDPTKMLYDDVVNRMSYYDFYNIQDPNPAVKSGAGHDKVDDDTVSDLKQFKKEKETEFIQKRSDLHVTGATLTRAEKDKLEDDVENLEVEIRALDELMTVIKSNHNGSRVYKRGDKFVIDALSHAVAVAMDVRKKKNHEQFNLYAEIAKALEVGDMSWAEIKQRATDSMGINAIALLKKYALSVKSNRGETRSVREIMKRALREIISGKVNVNVKNISEGWSRKILKESPHRLRYNGHSYGYEKYGRSAFIYFPLKNVLFGWSSVKKKFFSNDDKLNKYIESALLRSDSRMAKLASSYKALDGGKYGGRHDEMMKIMVEDFFGQDYLEEISGRVYDAVDDGVYVMSFWDSFLLVGRYEKIWNKVLEFSGYDPEKVLYEPADFNSDPMTHKEFYGPSVTAPVSAVVTPKAVADVVGEIDEMIKEWNIKIVDKMSQFHVRGALMSAAEKSSLRDEIDVLEEQLEALKTMKRVELGCNNVVRFKRNDRNTIFLLHSAVKKAMEKSLARKKNGEANVKFNFLTALEKAFPGMSVAEIRYKFGHLGIDLTSFVKSTLKEMLSSGGKQRRI